MGGMRKRVNPYDINTLNVFVRTESECKDCPFVYKRRVWGEGNYVGKLIICGEAPGADEDKKGRPFVGRSGKALDNMLDKVGIDRRFAWVTNIISCRPPENNFNDPQSVMARAKCYTGLEQELSFLSNLNNQNGFKVIATLGLNATRSFGISGSMSEIRGKEYECRGYTVVPTYHPSYIIRSHSQEVTDKWESDWNTIKNIVLLKTV